MAIIIKGTLAPWLKGEVKRHCIRCEAEVERLTRYCPNCGLQLRKECPACHYWGEIDRGYCLACKHSFPLPAPPPAIVRTWHEDRETADEVGQ
jgi:hypothetical protein